MNKRVRAIATVGATAVMTGALTVGSGACGGSEPPPKAPTKEAAEPETESGRDDDGLPPGASVMAEIGGLPPEGVQNTFMQAEKKLSKCFFTGVKRVAFMGGSVKFFVKVDGGGKFMHAHLEQSDLGDRKTEQCLLDVLIAYTWPTPVGGKVGVATFSMSFEHAEDITPPVNWPESRVTEALADVREPLEECKMGLPGKFTATVYIRKGERVLKDKDPQEVGVALTASATPPDEASEMAVDCIVKVLTEATYPSPGSSNAKVIFKL